MLDWIIGMILVGIIGSAVYYLYKAKKAGQHCVGCPHSKCCGGHCHGGTNH